MIETYIKYFGDADITLTMGTWDEKHEWWFLMPDEGIVTVVCENPEGCVYTDKIDEARENLKEFLESDSDWHISDMNTYGEEFVKDFPIALKQVVKNV